MQLIHNWKKAWKFFSVQLGLIGTAISGTYAVMFEQLKGTVDPILMAKITAGVFVAGIIGRIISQGIEK